MLYSYLWSFMWLLAIACARPPPKVDERNDKPPRGFPLPLNKKNFEVELSNGFHLVEFYSPYCSHCKNLAPIWEDTWVSFREEGKKLNMKLSQVNCVESGDICHKEDIRAYPTIRLYGPDGFLEEYHGKRTKEEFLKFARKSIMEYGDTDDLILPSLSKLLSGKDFSQLISGKSTKPMLVSFWPTSDMQEDSSVEAKFHNCPKCEMYQRKWNLINNAVDGLGVDSGHLNCGSEQNLCERLGFADLASSAKSGGNVKPRLALIIPKKVTNNLFIYPEGQDVSNQADVLDFIKRISVNSEAAEVSESEIIGYSRNSMPLFSEFVHSNAKKVHSGQNIYIIFCYNHKTVVPEDFTILEHLVEPLASRPNTYLRKFNGTIPELTKKVYDPFYQVVNYNDSEPRKELNEEFQTMSAVTEYPTFLIIKEGELQTHVFNGFSTTEMRNLDTILDWIDDTIVPSLPKLTWDNFEEMLNVNPSKYRTMAILLMSTKWEYDDKVNAAQKFFTSFLDYEHVRMQKMFEIVQQERLKKANAIEKMREKQENTKNILAKMRQEISHPNDRKVQYMYLDLAKDERLLKRLGVHNANIAPNQVLLIDKARKTLYAENHFEERLTGKDTYGIREAILSINIPEKCQLSTILRGQHLKIKLQKKIKIPHVKVSNGSNSNILYFFAILLLLVLLRKSPVYRMISRKWHSHRASYQANTSYSKLEAQD